MSLTVANVAPEWQPSPRDLPALFDALIPVAQPDGTIAVYAETGDGRLDQPLVRLDPGTFGIFADYCGLVVKQVNGR